MTARILTSILMLTVPVHTGTVPMVADISFLLIDVAAILQLTRMGTVPVLTGTVPTEALTLIAGTIYQLINHFGTVRLLSPW